MTGAVEVLGHFTSVKNKMCSAPLLPSSDRHPAFQSSGSRFLVSACHLSKNGGAQAAPNDMWLEIWPRNATLSPGCASLVPRICMQAGQDRGQGS